MKPREQWNTLFNSVGVLLLCFSLLAPVTYASADTGLLGAIVSALEEDQNWNLRGYLTWGMSTKEVLDGLRAEQRDGVAMCEGINVYETDNPTVSQIVATAVVGDYTPFLGCYVSSLWGLYSAKYQFAYKKMSDDELLFMYANLEKTVNYCYGLGERVIEKWETRGELEDLYYIIRTKWSKGNTNIYLHCYKKNEMYSVAMDYESPKYSEYTELLEQDLTVTGIGMFYGF